MALDDRQYLVSIRDSGPLAVVEDGSVLTAVCDIGLRALVRIDHLEVDAEQYAFVKEAEVTELRAALAAAAEREARYKKALKYVERKIDERTVEYDWDTFVRTVKEALS